MSAASSVFGRYGYRRTSMADVAQAACMSRPALYQWFANKAALFQAVAARVRDQVLEDADAAWPAGMALAEGLPAAILAKDLPLLRMLFISPHGAELLAVDAALTQTIGRELEQSFAALLARKTATQGRINLASTGTPESFGLLIGRLAAGLKHEATSEGAYVEDIRRLCRLIAVATQPIEAGVQGDAIPPESSG